MSVVYRKQIADKDGNLKNEISITKTVSRDCFFLTYCQDLGSLLKCSNGEKDFIIACLTLRYVTFDTNELVLNIGRRKEIAEKIKCSVGSLYNIVSSLKKKNIIVEHNYKMFLNPKLFFFGSEVERQKMLVLSINYEIK